MKKIIFFGIAASTFLFADTDVEQLKKQLEQQQLMIKKLETKIEAMSKKQTQIEQKQMSDELIKRTPNDSASFSQKAYLPDIAFILNMGAVGRDVNNSAYKNFEIPGFIDKGDAELPFNKNRGFNLNYAEVAMNSVVGPYFDAFAIFHLHPDEFEIEEAYVRTRALPYGLRVKAGKFRSAFGRLNEKH